MNEGVTPIRAKKDLSWQR